MSAALSGWAYAADAAHDFYRRLAYVPVGPDDPEPAWAVGDAWCPPHPLSLPTALCVALRRSADGLPGDERGIGTYYFPELDETLVAEIVGRFKAANAAWWNLDVDRWEMRLKRYGVGDCHPSHTDLYASSARRKIAGTVQLSRPQEYDGGALTLAHWGERLEMPRALGALVAFPGWQVHEVEPITRGVRWVLLVNGYGPPPR